MKYFIKSETFETPARREASLQPGRAGRGKQNEEKGEGDDDKT